MRTRLHTAVAAIAIAGAALTAACGSPEEDDAGDSGGDAITAGDTLSTGFYHWTEGGDIIPLFALRALRVTVDGKTVPFLSDENVSRYGLLPDAKSDKNPEGLPVGMTLGRASDTGLISIGFNCAACHTADIEYVAKDSTTKKVRADGAPGHFDFEGFTAAIGAAFKAELGPKASLWDKTKFATRAMVEASRNRISYGDFDGTADSAFSRFKMLMTVLLEANDGNIEELVNGFDLPPERKRLMIARYYTRNVKSGEGTVMGPSRTDPYTKGSNFIFGPFGVHGVPTAPLRAQPLYGMKDKAWFSYTSNTNAIAMRNTIQAMAVGGVTDLYGTDPTFVTSVNFPNLDHLEKAVYAIKPIPWPADLPYDSTLAERGKSIYQSVCASCHEPKAAKNGLRDVTVVPIAEVGTDDHLIKQYLTNFKTPLGNGNLGDLATVVVGKVQAKYCADAKLSSKECKQMDDTFDAADNPSGKRSDPKFSNEAIGYQADILDGIWTFGRLLHNGSVGSVADLLEPSAKRPKRFATGHRRYDATRLGYTYYPDLAAAAAAGSKDATMVLDTDEPGNSNAGHEGERFGTNLPAEDKLALLEYLKKHVSSR